MGPLTQRPEGSGGATRGGLRCPNARTSAWRVATFLTTCGTWVSRWFQANRLGRP